MDKLDKYFKDSMEGAQAHPKGWNVPSELPWENAKAHFPQPRPRRKSILWWLAAAAVLLSSTVYLTTFKPAEVVETANNQRDADASVANASTEVFEGAIPEQQASLPLPEKPIPSVTAEAKNQAEPSTTSGLAPDKASTSSKRNGESITEAELLVPIRTVEQTESLASIDTVVTTSSELTAVDKRRDTPEPVATLDRQFEVVNPDYSSLAKDASVEKMTLSPMAEMPSFSKAFYRREIGVSHKLSLFSLNRIEFVDGRDEVNLNSNYINVNLHYTQWLGKKWSVSSGLFYSDVDANLYFSYFTDYDSSMGGEPVKEAFDRAVSQASVEETNDFLVAFLPSLTPAEGEEINIQGDLVLDLNYFQVPLMVNRHWVRPKMEYYVGAGANVGYFDIDQNDVLVDVYQENTIISEPSQIADLNLTGLQVSLILQAGLRRKIGSKFNVGLNTRLDLNNPIESGIDAGLYYRWGK